MYQENDDFGLIAPTDCLAPNRHARHLSMCRLMTRTKSATLQLTIPKLADAHLPFSHQLVQRLHPLLRRSDMPRPHIALLARDRPGPSDGAQSPEVRQHFSEEYLVYSGVSLGVNHVHLHHGRWVFGTRTSALDEVTADEGGVGFDQ